MINQPFLSEIYIYPVKSLAGIKVSNWVVNKRGLLHDRKWMLIDSDNKFLSQRRLPKMTLIKTQIIDNTLLLSTATSGSISLLLNPDDGEECVTTLWKDQCVAKTTTKEADQWLSDFLNIDCQLVYQPENSIRTVDQQYATPTDTVGFSDGFPFLITSEASLASLNEAMGLQLPMLRFRPNLVISQCESYAEDSWREITINNIGFRLPKPCSRCPVPTINLETAVRAKEPLATLNKIRRWNNRVFFGQNALHNVEGALSLGDVVTIEITGPRQPPL